MATSMELSPQNVVTALQELSVEKTETLVFHLGVQLKALDDIELQYSGRSRKRRFIQAWLDSDTQASWGKLVSGLKQIGMTVVAESVESTFIPRAEVPVPVCTSAPVSSATVPPVQAVSSPAPLETDGTSVELTMANLELLPVTCEGREVRIISEAAVSYAPIGYRLLNDATGAKVDNLKKESPEDTLRAIFGKWLRGDAEKSWRKLVECLKSCELRSLAKDVETALNM